MPIKPNQRIVNSPVVELWNDQGVVNAERVRDLSLEDIAALLRSSRVHFAVADVGQPLEWIASDDCYNFWKTEVKIRVVDPNLGGFRLEDFPGDYCYSASEWRPPTGESIVLLFKHH